VKRAEDARGLAEMAGEWGAAADEQRERHHLYQTNNARLRARRGSHAKAGLRRQATPMAAFAKSWRRE
jgi:hypothetical protein